MNPQRTVTLDSRQKERYSRQIKLPGIGEAGQQRLLDSRVLIVGLGGLGSPVALYLAAAGIGHLVLSDYDHVDESNLQRQIIHSQSDINELKVESASRSLLAINPDITVTCLPYELSEEELLAEVGKADAVVDCTDNFPSRFLLNRSSITTRTPLISGAGIRQEGQVITFDPRKEDSPCYECLYPDEGQESASCALEGVVAPLVGIIGTMQAQETINVLLGRSALTGTLMLFDGATMEWQRVKLPRMEDCPACGNTGVEPSVSR